MDEDDIKLILKQNKSNFVTYEIPPDIYSTKDNSEVVHTMGDHEETLKIEYNDISMKTKPFLTGLGGTFGTRTFGGKSFFFETSTRFTPYWGYKPTNAKPADLPVVYTREKIINLSTIDKIQWKNVVFLTGQ